MSVYENDDSGPALGFGWALRPPARTTPVASAGLASAPVERPAPTAPPPPPSAAGPVSAPAPEPVSVPPPAPEDEPLPPAAELPLVDLRTFPVDRSAARLLPAEVARFYTALPYGFEAGVPLIALADVSETAMLSLRLAIGGDVRFARAPRIELAAAISEAYAEPGRPPATPPRLSAEPETRFRLIIRLHAGETVDAGLYDELESARARAVEIADQIGGEEGTWPFVHGRFLRPEAVVSVDVVEEAAPTPVTRANALRH